MHVPLVVAVVPYHSLRMDTFITNTRMHACMQPPRLSGALLPMHPPSLYLLSCMMHTTFDPDT